MSTSPIISEEVTYCAVHADRETSLRCNKCDRYMCVECAVQTPVGYRCKQCVRQHEDKFFTATVNDDAIVFGVSAVLTGIIAVLAVALYIPLIFLFFIGIPVGGAISEVGLRLTKRRRSRQSALVATGGVIIGAIAGVLVYIVLSVGMFPPLEILWLTLVSDFRMLILVGIIAFIVYTRYK